MRKATTSMGSDAWESTRHATQALGRWVRRERELRNLFLIDVAEPLGIDKPTLSRIERGELVPNQELGEQLTIWVLQREDSDQVPVARTTDPETSHEAAASVTEITVSATRLAILQYLDRFHDHDYYQRDIYGHCAAEACIDEAIADHLRAFGKLASRSGVSTRRLELQRAGYVEDSGCFGVTKGGRRAIAWRITDKGKEAIA
jgi:transcriptional regulator with XRE-family HTH domain